MVDLVAWLRSGEGLSWSEAGIWAAPYSENPAALQPYWDALQAADMPHSVRADISGNLLQLQHRKLSESRFPLSISSHSYELFGLRAWTPHLQFWDYVLSCDYLQKQVMAWELRPTTGPIGQVRRVKRAVRVLQEQLDEYAGHYAQDFAPNFFGRSADLCQVYLGLGSGITQKSNGVGVPRLGL